MNFATNNSINLIIYLPLISALLCYILKNKLALTVSFFCYFSIIFLLIKNFKFIYLGKDISSNLSFFTPSLGLEYRVDNIIMLFLLLIIFIKIISLILYKFQLILNQNIKENYQFIIILNLNLFAIIGLVLSDNFINIFIFAELYFLTFIAFFLQIKKTKILENIFNYFCINSSFALLIFWCFILIYLEFGGFDVELIKNSFSQIQGKKNWYILLIFLIILISYQIKFLSIWFYYKIHNLSNNLSNHLFIEAIFINSLGAIFFLIKFQNLIEASNLGYVQIILRNSLTLLSFIIICYSSIKIIKTKHLTIISNYLCLNQLGIIFASIALHKSGSNLNIIYPLLNFTIMNLAIYICSFYIKFKFTNITFSNIKLTFIPNSIEKNKFLLHYPLLINALFLLLPLIFLMIGNLCLAINYRKFDWHLIMLIAIILANFSYLKIINKLYFKH